VTLIDFLNGYYKVGRDPYIPVLTIKNKKPVLSSLGLLRDDQYVGKVSLDDAYLITLLHESISELDIEAKIPLKPFKNHMESGGSHQHPKRKYAYASFNIRKGKAKTKLLNKRDARFQTNVKLDVDLLELSEEIRMEDLKVMEQFEKEVEKEIKHRYEKLLNYTQKLNTDPFGYGVVYRTQGRSTKTSMAEWRDIYPKINVTFNVKVHILHHGVLP
jgi:spore germination protein